MSNDNTLSEELQKRVEQSADSFVGRLSTQFQKTHQRIGYIAGATEYAPYKVKYEQAMVLLEQNFKAILARSRAFTQEEIEQKWKEYREAVSL